MTGSTGGPVVVGLGATPTDLGMVRLAAREADTHGRSLALVHAFNWEAALAGPSLAGSRDTAEELIARAATAANEVAPAVPVSGEIVEGAPVGVLVRRSETAFLVAIGDGGMTGCGRCVPADAPAVQLAARAGCPVLVVRPEPPPPGPVLVGVDGSPGSRAALDFAFGCAARRPARVIVVRVVEPGRPDGDDDPLGALVAEARRHHPEVAAECHTVHGDPGTVLVEQSRSAQVALVGARGDQPGRGMLGEVSQTLLYHAPAPVIVVRGLVSAVPAGA
ncbi:universal stress protein [Micromonospora rifamycinica]|uniref:Nucleotide-binding universal stress protein, UspA family n=1 Tax=Micromonospora rifamycinica TaxID=291594 RepID=A0A109IJ69_9ACTN|nr:universal stress protein [Micromonospora rifamycinica]KWV31544.1 universal stress protein UspA [Micromonospora rifamycinica]SCG51980.1 Nucleotide-binding universal stress protein, UspA family [Micromonospora rifamycinica]